MEKDIDDNLKKMAFHVVVPDFNKFDEAARTTNYDEEQDIEERISMVRAEELLEAYKRKQVEAEQKYGKERLAEKLEDIQE